MPDAREIHSAVLAAALRENPIVLRAEKVVNPAPVVSDEEDEEEEKKEDEEDEFKLKDDTELMKYIEPEKLAGSSRGIFGIFSANRAGDLATKAISKGKGLVGAVGDFIGWRRGGDDNDDGGGMAPPDEYQKKAEAGRKSIIGSDF